MKDFRDITIGILLVSSVVLWIVVLGLLANESAVYGQVAQMGQILGTMNETNKTQNEVLENHHNRINNLSTRVGVLEETGSAQFVINEVHMELMKHALENYSSPKRGGVFRHYTEPIP